MSTENAVKKCDVSEIVEQQSSTNSKTINTLTLNLIVAQLNCLSAHPRLKELQEEITLSSAKEKEQKHKRPEFWEIILGEISRKFSSTRCVLKLTPKGILKETEFHDNYGYTCPVEFLGRIYFAPPRKKGGVKHVSRQPVIKQDFPSLAIEFDLNSNRLQKIIEHLEA